MYFKRLELIGFKSFPEKTQVNFEPGITAIIGPNGCGKTNISDAIRWVLGEQSAKSLRGHRMEDIIFNGTEVHKPLSMSEVSLTLNNEDKIIPIEYSEVTVTRRCYRSGESEYLINKTPCRLRDIQELFMDTGIGTESYSVMEQGKVDLILSSRPEDRRFVLEEAAGIAKYNARKNAALRKLDLTNQNLLRIDDIIAEVKREVISIKRQVTKAEKYKESYERLKRLETNLSLKKYKVIKDEAKALQEKIKQLKDESNTLNVEVAQEESKEEVLHLKVIDIEKSLASARDRFLASADQVNNVENQVGALKERTEHLKTRAEKATQEIKDIQEKGLEVQKRVETEGKGQSEVQENIKAVEASMAEKENSFSSILEVVRNKEKELEEDKNKIFEKVREITVLNNELKKININFADTHKNRTKKSALISRLNLLVEWDKAHEGYRHSIAAILKELKKANGRSALIPELIRIETDRAMSVKKEEINRLRQEVEGDNIEQNISFDDILAQKKEAIEALEKEREYLKEEVDKKVAEFQPLKDSLEEAREIKEKARLSFAGLQEKDRGMELHLRTLRERFAEYGQNEARLKEEITHAISENENFKDKFEALQKEKENFANEKISLKEEMDRLEEERKEANVVFREEEDRLRKERAVVNKRMQEFHNLEISMTQKEAELSNIKERISNVYHVDLDTVSLAPEGEGEGVINEEEMRMEIQNLRQKVESMGSVNLMAIEENKELEDRFSLLKKEREDILKAKEELHQVISKINHTCRKKFSDTLEKVRIEFHKIFRLLFNGGKADLILQEGDILESGIEIMARPPGKNLSTINQLSGGEKALTAIALLFALFRIRPSPFCVLDEIDAPLDDSNISRFGSLLKEFVKTTQFIIITHSKKTISLAQVIYGITMQKPGISEIISMKFARHHQGSGAGPKDSHIPAPSPVSSR